MVVAEEMDVAEQFEAGLLVHQKLMNEATARGDSAVQQFYCDAVVFLTGGSGFVGKQFIEKLLRATNVAKIFVLLRSKKGKPIQQRLKEMLEDPVYDMVRRQKPDFEEKIVPVEGDVADIRLGLSDKDWQMVTQQTNIIFHMAATTRFDECLRVSTMINVRGTREALILGKACKKLKSYVHVSTAYAHACENLINTEVYEDFYKAPVDPESLIKLAESITEERLNEITPGLIKNWPNTYSFAKAVAEETVRTLSGDLPLCIVRPAIVICAKREPNPGWIDMSSAYGASAIVLGPALGITHILYVNGDVHIGLIPVDYVNNAIIAAAWETARRRAVGDKDIKIYTVISSSRNPVKFGSLIRHAITNVKDNYATPEAVGRNFTWFTDIRILFLILTWILHIIPGYCIDGVCFVIGKPRRFMKLYKKMYIISMALSYFTVNDWQFVDKNTEKLYESLSTVDKDIFEFDVNKIDWIEYMTLWCIGLRKYVLKDNLKNTEYGKKKQFLFKIMMIFISPIYLYSLYKVSSIPFIVLSYIYNNILVNKLC